MKVAIITKSATTKSGARVPIELALHLSPFCQLILFAEAKNAQKKLKKTLAKQKVELIFYQNPIELYRKLKAGEFDVISFHATRPEMLSAKLTLKPIVKTYYGTQFDAYLENFLPNQKVNQIHKTINFFGNLLIWLEQKLQLLLATEVIAISKACQKELQRTYNTKSAVIYLGSDIKPGKNQLLADNISQQEKNQQPIKLLSVSRITPYKGFHLIIEIVRKLRFKGYNLKLTLAGSLGKKNYLDYLMGIKNKNDEIILNVEDHILKKLHQKSDIYLTCDRYLFFGLPLLEAAQFGKPAITLNNKAASELIIHGQTGYLADSLHQFPKYLKMLLKDWGLRKRIGENAQSYVREKFNWPEIAHQYFKLFEKTLNVHK